MEKNYEKNSILLHNLEKNFFFLILSRISKKKMQRFRFLFAGETKVFFYKKTQDPVLLKERLGHSDIRTTMKYTHLDEEKIKKSADAMR